jgi:hypothetical protein
MRSNCRFVGFHSCCFFGFDDGTGYGDATGFCIHIAGHRRHSRQDSRLRHSIVARIYTKPPPSLCVKKKQIGDHCIMNLEPCSAQIGKSRRLPSMLSDVGGYGRTHVAEENTFLLAWQLPVRVPRIKGMPLSHVHSPLTPCIQRTFRLPACHAYDWLPSNVQLTAFSVRNITGKRKILWQTRQNSQKKRRKDIDLIHMLLCSLSSML